MTKPTVHAVMRVTIEVPVRASECGETFEQMHKVAKHEAESILRNNLPDKFHIAGPVEFSHAVVKVHSA